MSKIKTIKIENLKSISEFEANFDGCTAIVTAGNNKGKTTLLKLLPDRIRGEKPEIIVKQGEESGKGEMILTSGERFEWVVTSAGKEKLTIFTKDNIKSSVTKEIAARFFPPVFDIDKFLQSQPKQQALQLQKVVGLDFAEIDKRYTDAFNKRTQLKADFERERLRLENMGTPAKVEPVTLDALTAKKEQLRTDLNNLYAKNVEDNKKLENDWKAECNAVNAGKAEHEKKVADIGVDRERVNEAIGILFAHGYENCDVLHSWKDVKYPLPPVKQFTLPVEPTYIDPMPDRSELDAIDAEIISASNTNMKAAEYAAYVAQQETVSKARAAAIEQDGIVKNIESERKEMTASAKLPAGVEITENGVLVDGLPLDRSQLSASKLYITALQFASLNCGEVRTLYFDASFLDRNSLNEVNSWADANGFQLLIERPDFDGGEIKYELICNEEAKEESQKDLCN